jgi:hypothetical protein
MLLDLAVFSQAHSSVATVRLTWCIKTCLLTCGSRSWSNWPSLAKSLTIGTAGASERYVTIYQLTAYHKSETWTFRPTLCSFFTTTWKTLLTHAISSQMLARGSGLNSRAFKVEFIEFCQRTSVFSCHIPLVLEINTSLMQEMNNGPTVELSSSGS